MLKIALALPLTLAAVVGHSTTTATAAPVEQAAPTPVPNRASCDVCYEIYDNCIAEGITPAGCQRLSANCFRTCLP